MGCFRFSCIDADAPGKQQKTAVGCKSPDSPHGSMIGCRYISEPFHSIVSESSNISPSVVVIVTVNV